MNDNTDDSSEVILVMNANVECAKMNDFGKADAELNDVFTFPANKISTTAEYQVN